MVLRCFNSLQVKKKDYQGCSHLNRLQGCSERSDLSFVKDDKKVLKSAWKY